jgi:septum formation protein
VKKLILASQSPRRAEILKNAGFVFSVLPTYVSEIPDENLSLDEQILKIAEDKALAAVLSLSDQSLDAIVLSADTMVCIENKPIGKPVDERDAEITLRLLSGTSHFVKTAVVLIDVVNHLKVSHIETTQVRFRKLTEIEIVDYIATGEPMDKAGSYGIQGIGKKFIESIDGDYDNVVGLPMKAVQRIFKEKKWAFIKS